MSKEPSNGFRHSQNLKLHTNILSNGSLRLSQSKSRMPTMVIKAVVGKQTYRPTDHKSHKIKRTQRSKENLVHTIHVYLVKEIGQASASLSGTSFRNSMEILVFHLNEFCLIPRMKLVYASMEFIVQSYYFRFYLLIGFIIILT